MRHLLALSLAFASTGLAACATGPVFTAPPAPAPTALASAGDATHPAPGAPTVSAKPAAVRWWTEFGSAELTALVDAALAHNATLAASDAALARAREAARAVGGLRLPQADLSARAERQEVNLAAFGFDPGPSGNPTFNL